jgi:hypothetical protein
MAKVVIDVSISLAGFVAGPGDDRQHPLGGRGGEHIFDWISMAMRPMKARLGDPAA